MDIEDVAHTDPRVDARATLPKPLRDGPTMGSVDHGKNSTAPTVASRQQPNAGPVLDITADLFGHVPLGITQRVYDDDEALRENGAVTPATFALAVPAADVAVARAVLAPTEVTRTALDAGTYALLCLSWFDEHFNTNAGITQSAGGGGKVPWPFGFHEKQDSLVASAFGLSLQVLKRDLEEDIELRVALRKADGGKVDKPCSVERHLVLTDEKLRSLGFTFAHADSEARSQCPVCHALLHSCWIAMWKSRSRATKP
jgi:hypothetical protein